MLCEIFYKLLAMNVTASVTAVLLLAFHTVLCKIGCPRKSASLLWAIIALRFLCPCLPQTPFSIFNASQHNEITQKISARLTVSELDLKEERQVFSEAQTETGAQTRAIRFAASVWLIGIAALAAKGGISALQTKRKLRFALKYRDNIFMAEQIPTSFVFGLIKPNIYIPLGTEEKQLDYIITHEQIHVWRKDSLRKLFAYLLATIHWFNPLVWFLAGKFSDDTEFICDEMTLSQLGGEHKRHYAEALFQNASLLTKKTPFCTVGFSNGIIKRRIQNVIAYRKPSAFRRKVAALACCLAVFPFCTDAVVSIPKTETKLIPTATVFRAEPKPSEFAAHPEEAKDSAQNTEHETEKTSLAAPKPSEAPISELTEIPAAETKAERTSRQISGEYDSKQGQCAEKRLFCDNEGNIAVFFQMNTECLMNIGFYDEETGEELESGTVLADGKTVHLFSGFESKKSYRLVFGAKTASDWEINGSYQIYC